jgi:hypothetical protein
VGPSSEQSLSSTLMTDESMEQPLNYFNYFIGLTISGIASELELYPSRDF